MKLGKSVITIIIDSVMYSVGVSHGITLWDLIGHDVGDTISIKISRSLTDSISISVRSPVCNSVRRKLNSYEIR